jgi:protein-tyrosine phosphatase
VPEPTRVLFVCLGNICRSPLAEAVVRARAVRRGLDDRFVFASAGTGDWHVGCPADRRSVAIARRFGLGLDRHRARQITAEGINAWDWFVAMDASNRMDLLAMGAPASRVLMMRRFEGVEPAPDVPDPYYGGESGFERVFRLLEANADPLLDHMVERT